MPRMASLSSDDIVDHVHYYSSLVQGDTRSCSSGAKSVRAEVVQPGSTMTSAVSRAGVGEASDARQGL